MTNYRDRFQDNQPKKLDTIDTTAKRAMFENQSSRLMNPSSDASYLTEAESERYVKAHIKQSSRYIPEIDYKDPSTFCFFGSAEKYYEDSIKSIYSTYPYDGSKAEKMEWMLSASYLDLYVLEHEYPKSTGHIIFDRASDTITDDTNYPTTNNVQYIKFFGGPHKNTIYNSAENRESNLKIDGTPGNTIEFWMKKDSDAWYTAGRKEVIVDVVSSVYNSADQFGRISVELEDPSTPGQSPILFTYLSGTTGANKLRIGSTSITTSSVGDGQWHHYAISALTSGSSTHYKLYVNGALDSTNTQSHVVGAVDRAMTGTIGALAADSLTGNKGAGKLDASLDEFRFWKTARDEKEIGRFWYTPVHGGTDADHTNASLGIYYKFNEGITSATAYDKVVLDYSGRINNGEIVGYASAMRSTVSSMALSQNITDTSFVEIGDPIINSQNSEVLATNTRLKEIGKSRDLQNLASLSNSIPSYFMSEDNGLLKELLQVMGSAFDDIFIKIKNLPKIKDFAYQEFFKEKGQYRESNNASFLMGCEDLSLFEFTGNHTKPWVNHILRHFGMVTTDVLSSADLFETFFNRTEEVTFEHNLEEVKRLILSNIHKNLVHIFKTKGTEEGFRNLIRCFGIDEELIKLNAYGSNEEYELITKPLYSTIKQKSISFEGENYLGTVYQVAPDADSVAYITGSSKITPFTMEANIVFPKKGRDIDVGMTEVSLFGMHSVSGSESPANALTWHAIDSGSFQAGFVKRTTDSEDGYFKLSSTSNVFQTITSSYIPGVYDNSHWNISVRIGAKSDIDFNIIPADSSTRYLIEFTGYNYDLDVLKESFHVTQSIGKDDYERISNQNKAVFIGSHKTNFSGSHLVSSDVRVLGFNTWKDVLTEEELKEHAQNPQTYGRKKPQSVSNFDTGRNQSTSDSLILRWQFENLTASNGSYQMSIEDFSTGSATSIFQDDVSGFKHPGLAVSMVSSSAAIFQEFIPGVNYHGIDNSYSSDRVKVKTQELEKFKADSKPVTYTFMFEKSMYQVVSKEMVNFFAGVVGYNNLLGEPVNKYRKEYKLLEKVRERFFMKVRNNMDLDKFVEYYKWIDGSLSVFLNQLVPASSFLGSEIKDVVESHVLERNKYKHPAPTIEFKDPADKIFPILGVNELLYDWEHGHAPLKTTAPINEKVIQFSANGHTIDIADSDDLSFTDGSGTDSPFSISAWVHVGDISSDSGVIISRRNRDGTAPQLGEWIVEHVNGKLKAYLYADHDYNGQAGFVTSNRLIFESSVANLSSATWHFITVTYDGSENTSGLKVYKDGTEITTGKTVTKTNYSGMPNYNIVTTIGGTDTPTTNTFDDFIADVAVFNKELSSVEVTEAYNGGKVKDLTTFSAYNNIISWWKMGDDVDAVGSNNIRDYKGSNHGTLVGASIIDYSNTDLPSDEVSIQSRSWNPSEGEAENCLWHKERQEVGSDRAEIKRITTSEVSGSTYVRRALTKPYKISGNEDRNIKAGFNRKANKLIPGLPAIIEAHTITITSGSIFKSPVCYDVLEPAKLETYRGKTDVTGTDGYLDGDADLLLPFTLVSSSSGKDFEEFRENLVIANNHLSIDATGEKPLQGPFAETHIGGMPHNKVNFRTLERDLRPEAYSITATDSTFTLEKTPINLPKSMFFRGISGTRFANIANISHDTSSYVLGNYNKDYEIVMTSGRLQNNRYFVDHDGEFTQTNGIPTWGLTGAVDFLVPDRGRSEHVIVNRFSAPGGPETSGKYALDRESGELSIYNTINYRNTMVRDAQNLLSAERSNQFGIRTGTGNMASIHMTNRNKTYSTGSESRTVKYDNFFVQHPIPSNDYGYAWITASADGDVFGFISRNENRGHQSKFAISGSLLPSQTINFISASSPFHGGDPLIDFAQMNYYATSSLNTSTNTLSYVDTKLNSQILNLQGPYGWPTWKQLRGQDHPLSRYERKNGKLSIVIGRNSDGSITALPKTSQEYFYSSNKHLSNLDNIETKSRSKEVESFTEIMATNKFNPITITFHSAQALDINTNPISQAKHERYWTNDETSLVSLGDAASVSTTAQGENTRLASMKLSYGNALTMFSNQKLANRLSINDVKDDVTVDSFLKEMGELSLEDEDIYATEVNYIETIYPREINTFTKEARTRELFDFYGWRTSRADRSVTLSGSNVYTWPLSHTHRSILTVGTAEAFPRMSFDKFENKLTNGFAVDAVDVNTVTSGSGDSLVLKHINSSRWPLDSRTTFTSRPISITSSYFADQKENAFFSERESGERGEGVFQNDYSIFALGYNSLHGTPPPAMIYNRRIPQTFDSDELLAGEAKWTAADQIGRYPFENSYTIHSENFRQIGQDHSLVPEFIISDHVENILTENGGDFNNVQKSANFLSVTGALYNTSSQTLQVSQDFYRTYGTSDMMKYFGMVLEKSEENNLGMPYKLTLRCKAAMKFTPYKGFYPAERVQQIGEIFNRGYMSDFNYQTTDTTPSWIDDSDLGQKQLLQRKVRANMQQSIKPLFAPGVLMNSIKAGMAVDYPLFSGDNSGVQKVNGTTIFSTASLASDFFGMSIATHESLLFVSATGDDGIASSAGTGYVFRKSGTTWSEIDQLTGSGLDTSSKFGRSAVMSSTHLAVHSPFQYTVGPYTYLKDRVFIYPVVDGVVQKTTMQHVSASIGAHGTAGGTAGFAAPLATEGDDLFVGIPAGSSSSGVLAAGHVLHFKKQRNVWGAPDVAGTNTRNEKYILTASVPETFLRLGTSLAFDGTTLAAGAPGQAQGSSTGENFDLGGAVYIYTRRGESDKFEQAYKIFSNDYQQGQLFGQQCALSDGVLAVAAPYWSGDVLREGAVYIFSTNSSGVFKQAQRITSPSPGGYLNGNFGQNISLSGDLLLIEQKTDSNDEVETYIFKKNETGRWDFLDRISKDQDNNHGTDTPYYRSVIGKDQVFIGDISEASNGTVTGSVMAYDIITDAVSRHNTNKRAIVFPTSSFHTDLQVNNSYTGSLVNNTVDAGIPRLSGSAYKRVTFEDILEPSRLVGTVIKDQEPHPSASLYYGDKLVGRVLEYPFTFGKLDPSSNEVDLGVSEFTLGRSLESSLKPYRLAVNNFTAETVNFFLKDNKLATIESLPVNPNLLAGESYKMRVHVRNNNLRMYDRHSAFGPPVDEGNIELLSDGSVVAVSASHAHSPFVPPFLDPGSEPYVEITFTPQETRNHTLEEILRDSKYDYVNFSAVPSNPNDNTNYKHAMSISASLKLDNLVAYEAQENIDPGTELTQRHRWVIQSRWETPTLNFVSATGSALRLSDNAEVEITAADGDPATPWQRRRWSNFYSSVPDISNIAYLTSSVGMWHQSGALPSAEEGYTISIEAVPGIPSENQLAERVGFIKNSTVSVKTGELAEKKIVSEAVIAIPFVEPELSTGPVKYFTIDNEIRAKAQKLNDNKKKEFVNNVRGSGKQTETYKSEHAIYQDFYNNPGQTKIEAAAYQLRMEEKFVVPPQFEGKMKYVFQFNAEFTKEDLANIWQNVSPKSDFSTTRLKYSSVDNTQANAGESQDIQYVSNFLPPDLRPYIENMDFANSKVRWLIIKAKQRAQFDLNQVKINSLPGVERQLKLDESVGSIKPTKELLEQPYSFNWPYDFFSIVELVKLEGKVDIFKGVAPPVPEEE